MLPFSPTVPSGVNVLSTCKICFHMSSISMGEAAVNVLNECPWGAISWRVLEEDLSLALEHPWRHLQDLAVFLPLIEWQTDCYSSSKFPQKTLFLFASLLHIVIRCLGVTLFVLQDISSYDTVVFSQHTRSQGHVPRTSWLRQFELMHMSVDGLVPHQCRVEE